MLKHDLLMDALDLNSDAGSNKLNPSFLQAIPESDTASNLLDGDLGQGDFVRDQIQNLDKLFDAQGLQDLKSSDRSESARNNNNDQRQNMLLSKLYEMEDQVNEKDEKCKEQSKINQELADKIQ